MQNKWRNSVKVQEQNKLVGNKKSLIDIKDRLSLHNQVLLPEISRPRFAPMPDSPIDKLHHQEELNNKIYPSEPKEDKQIHKYKTKTSLIEWYVLPICQYAPYNHSGAPKAAKRIRGESGIITSTHIYPHHPPIPPPIHPSTPPSIATYLSDGVSRNRIALMYALIYKYYMSTI